MTRLLVKRWLAGRRLRDHALPIRSAAGVAATLVLVTGCGDTRTGQAPVHVKDVGGPVGGFDANGVTVSVGFDFAKSTPGTGGLVDVEFAPDQPGFHLYSIGMPDDGVQGIGRPIRVAVSGALTADGAPSADRPVKSLRLDGLDVDLPVYPDGPVVVTVPVRLTPGSNTTARVTVGYAACSEKTCLAPVSGRTVDFPVPGRDTGHP